MTGKESVSAIRAQRGMTLEVLADKLGYPHISGISEKLRSGKYDMRVDTLVNIMSAMDCEVVVRSKLKDKTEIILTVPEENKE